MIVKNTLRMASCINYYYIEEFPLFLMVLINNLKSGFEE